MFNFFESVVGIFGTVVGYIVGLFEMMLNLVKLIGKAMVFLFDVIASLPPFMMIAAVLFVSLAIMLQIMNKGA